jgi:hypothetical protein
VFHREQRRRGARGDAYFAVGVLDVPIGGLDRNSKRPRDVLRLQPAGEHGDYLGLALGEPRRSLEAWSSLTGGLEHSRDRVGVEPYRARLLGQDLRSLLGNERLSMWPRLDHCVVSVSGGE